MNKLARQATDEAVRFFEDVARGLIRDAIEFRRENPCFFAKYRRILARLHRDRGHRIRAAWHSRWADRYEARCTAEHTLLAATCGFCKDETA